MSERAFRVDLDGFMRRTKRRVAFETVGLALAGAFFYWTTVLPSWMEAVLLVAGGVFIIGGLALLPRAKRIVAGIIVQLEATGLRYTAGESSLEFPYRGLLIQNVKRRDGRIAEILIRGTGGAKVCLSNLDDMDALLSELQARIEQARSRAH